MLLQVSSNSDEWRDVAMNVSESDWKEGSIVAITPWMENMTSVQLPPLLRDILQQGCSSPSTPLTPTSPSSPPSTPTTPTSPCPTPSSKWNITLEEAAELAQWSDILLFDYITGKIGKISAMSLKFFSFLIEVF